MPPHTVLEVSARVKKSVPLYKGDNEFSILEGGNYAFKTVSPDLVHSDQRNTCDGVQQRYVAKEYFLDATQGTDANFI